MPVFDEDNSKDSEEKDEPVPDLVDDDNSEESNEQNNTENPTDTFKNSKFPKCNQCVKYRTPQCKDWISVKVMGKAGKSSGKYSSWLNIQRLDDGVEQSINWDDIAEWNPIEHNVHLTTIQEHLTTVKIFNNIKEHLRYI